jgi:hypothetical protein
MDESLYGSSPSVCSWLSSSEGPGLSFHGQGSIFASPTNFNQNPVPKDYWFGRNGSIAFWHKIFFAPYLLKNQSQQSM